MKTMTWKVYGREGHRQRETFFPSFHQNMDEPDNPWRRPVVIDVQNADITGTHEYSIVKITAPTEELCQEEFLGQLSDGIFENSWTGKIEFVSEER